MNYLFLLRLSFIAVPFTGAFSAYANVTFPTHPAPKPAEEWIDTDSTSHNHNTYIQFNMENIRKQPIKQYDAYGSWYFLENQSPGAMDFHYSPPVDANNDGEITGEELITAGKDHPDAIHFGHGFIPSVRPIIYEYVNVPSNQIDVIDQAFQEWNTQINTNPSVFRKPGTVVGFNWKQKSNEMFSDIKVFWENLTTDEGEAGAFFNPATKEIKFDSEPELFNKSEYWFDNNGNSMFDPMVDTFVDNNSNGMFDANIDLKLGWHLPVAGQVDIYNYDLYTTALHEIAHAVGLDDLYNLIDLGRFPDSLMGSGGWEYWLQDYIITGMPAPIGPRQLPMRRIDVGSIQGGVDLYTIPVPGPTPLMGLAIAFGYSRKLRRFSSMVRGQGIRHTNNKTNQSRRSHEC